MRIFIVGLVLAVAVFGGWVMAVRSGALNPTEEYLTQRYTDARSKFVTIDGVPMHVVEEGQGPVIVLIHGYLSNNRQWDGWADDLRKDFRVVRFDYPPFGLSGPDSTGQYSSSRAYPLIEGLLDELGYERFHIGGTSSGSILALRYAADHPERVDKLLLSTVPAYAPGDRIPPPLRYRAMIWFTSTVTKVWKPELYWQMFLENIFGDPARIKPGAAQEYADLNNRAGANTNGVTFVMTNARSTFDVAEAAGKITGPVLLQWAGKSPVLTTDGLNQVAPMFSKANLKVIEYSDLGHMLTYEDPARTVADVRAFLSE